MPTVVCRVPHADVIVGRGVLALLVALMCWGLFPRAIQAAPPTVLTTVAPLTNIVKNMGGATITLHGLVPEGTNSHTFEPPPSAVKYVVAADLIILNGLDLETPIEKLARAQKKPSAQILKLGDRTIAPQDYVFDRSFPKAKGHPNPHLWMSPLYAVRYAELGPNPTLKP